MARPARFSDLVSQHKQGLRNFRVVDVSGSSVTGATFSECDFNSSNLEGCRIADTTFERCTFVGTNLRGTDIGGRVTFRHCSMANTRLSAASMSGVVFEACGIEDATFESARLTNVKIEISQVNRTSFANAMVNRTDFATSEVSALTISAAVFISSNLVSVVEDKDIAFGDGAVIDWRSVCRSLRSPNLEAFLVATGMPDVFATYLVSCAKAIDPARLFKLMRSTFISYGGPNVRFASKLRDNLRRNGVDTFFFASDAVPGERLSDTMRKGVNNYDRVIVVCSASALKRPGVRNEIKEALDRESRDGGASYLIPVAVDDAVFDLDDDLARVLRGRVVADFRKRREYDVALRKLLKALSRDAVDGA